MDLTWLVQPTVVPVWLVGLGMAWLPSLTMVTWVALREQGRKIAALERQQETLANWNTSHDAHLYRLQLHVKEHTHGVA